MPQPPGKHTVKLCTVYASHFLLVLQADPLMMQCTCLLALPFVLPLFLALPLPLALPPWHASAFNTR